MDAEVLKAAHATFHIYTVPITAGSKCFPREESHSNRFPEDVHLVYFCCCSVFSEVCLQQR